MPRFVEKTPLLQQATQTARTSSSLYIERQQQWICIQDFSKLFLWAEKRTRFVSYGVVEENEAQTSCLIVQQIQTKRMHFVNKQC